jgi:hypothetical protein
VNSIETNAFLTRAALLDPRMKRTDPLEQADMAAAWADVLADVPLADAVKALSKHYRGSTVPIMPANVLEMLGVVDEVESSIPDVTAEVVAESKRRALAAAGVTEAELDAHSHDVAWLRAHFPAVEVTAGDPEDFPE